jgi:hypothetical protein
MSACLVRLLLLCYANAEEHVLELVAEKCSIFDRNNKVRRRVWQE